MATGHYDRRDLIGHYIEKRQRTQHPCGHACCRGYRVHPANMPVILPDRTLRRATDDDLQQHFLKVTRDESPKARRAEAQILHEMARRDREAEKRAEREDRRTRHREAVAAGRMMRRTERDTEYERIKTEAEKHTQGYLVNARGRARGISDAELLTGREDVFRRYASDEAKEYFASHPRPTSAHLVRGVDTRVHEKSTEPRRRRRPLRGVRQSSRLLVSR